MCVEKQHVLAEHVADGINPFGANNKLVNKSFATHIDEKYINKIILPLLG